MKKYLLLVLLFVGAYGHSFAYLTQGHFRWRNNDGTEKTATWKAPVDSAIKISDFKAVRLRMEIYNAQTSTKGMDRSLVYATSLNGPWYGINDETASAPFTFEGNTAYTTNNDSTTQQIADPTYAFLPGNIINTGDVYNDTIPVNKRREYEWCIKPTPYILANTTYYFKSSVGYDQSILPSLTTTGTAFSAGPQPILSNGGFENNSTGWTTSPANGSTATFTLTTAALQVHTGSKALLVNVTNAGTSNSVTLSHAPVTLDTGTYLLRFWAIAKQRNAILNVTLNGVAANNTCRYQIYDRGDTTKNGWQMYQYAFKGSGAATTLQMSFNTNTTYYIDDIEIVSSTTNPNINVQYQYDWQNNFNATYGWLSGDNGNPVLLPDNRTAYVYNDSFVGNRNIASNTLSTNYIVNNLLAVQNGDQLSSVYGGSTGSARNLFSPGDGNIFWNAGGLVENGVLKTVLIEISGGNYNGNTWIGDLNLPDLTVKSLTKLPATISTPPNCVMADGAYDYLYFGASSSSGEVHTVVGRVPAGQLDSQTAWQFYAGNNVWTTDFTKAANLLEGTPAGDVVKLGPGNYAMSGVPNLTPEIDVWFAPSPIGPWTNKSVIYNIPQEEGVLAYQGHLDPLGKNGVYTFSYSLYPFVADPVAMQVADKTTYVPCYAKANLIKLSPYSGLASPDSLIGFTAKPNGRQISVTWQTSQTTNNHFELDHSTDGLTWTSVGTISGNGTSSYQASIPEPLNGPNYYRLKLFDEDNKMSLSAVKSFFVNENVVLKSFTAQPGSKIVNVSFSTSSEYFNDHFTVQSSTDSSAWTTLATIQGAGTTTTAQNYSAVDNGAVNGFNYYRLQYYSNGALVYTPVQKVDTRPSVIISTGSVHQQGSSVILQMTASSQVNNPGFTAQRSPDGNAWITLDSYSFNSVTQLTPQFFTATDASPLVGLNYYRLQYYLHGAQVYSQVLSLNTTGSNNVVLNVYPNPANANVSFDLKNYTGKTFTATVTSLYGKQVSKQTIAVTSDGHYVLPTNASTGTYILNINGDNGLAKSSRVLVQ